MALRPGRKTIFISITRGTLLAYEGTTPVFTTLVSPGAGGVPVKGKDPVRASTTPLGTYTVTFKDRAATMSPEKGDNRSFWIADVPFTQYFNPPFALHASYWHERFGSRPAPGASTSLPSTRKRCSSGAIQRCLKSGKAPPGPGRPRTGSRPRSSSPADTKYHRHHCFGVTDRGVLIA